MHPAQKISNSLRFKNGFEIRDLHHFASKNVPHTISQILRVTEKMYVNSWLVSAPRPKNFKFAPIQKRFEIRDLHHFESKNVPHTISQILRVTEKMYVNSWLVSAPRPKNFKFAPIQKRFEIRDLHHFESKNVPHTISQILRVTEKMYVNSWLVSAPRPKNFKFAPIQKRFEIRDLHHFESKNVPHTISQIFRVTEKVYVNSWLVSAPRPKHFKFAPIGKRRDEPNLY